MSFAGHWLGPVGVALATFPLFESTEAFRYLHGVVLQLLHVDAVAFAVASYHGSHLTLITPVVTATGCREHQEVEAEAQ